jgi:hypothetical protein
VVGADDGAQRVVHVLGLGLLDCVLERGARCCCGRVGGDRGVRVQVVVVVGGCAYDWALETDVVLVVE